jgi:two-component system response regulator QseB
MRILLVEDDPMIGDSVRQALKLHSYTVDWVNDGNAAELAITNHSYNLLLLDLGLPKKDGLAVLRHLRKQNHTMPVLIVTARDSVADRIEGLNLGADDYLIKPFDLEELSARVRALLRRHAGRANPLIEFGALTLNPINHEVFLRDRAIPLSAREFALLHALMEEPGRILSRTELEEKLYGWGEEIESNTIEVYIYYLRKKLGTQTIRNVRGVGYMVTKPPAEPAA